MTPTTRAGKALLDDFAPIEAWKDSAIRATQRSVRDSAARDISAIEAEARQQEREATTPTLSGWWSVRSVDRLPPEHMEQVREQLTEAMERGDVLVTVEGMTFIWHELDRWTEGRVRAEARQQEREALAERIEELRTDDGHLSECCGGCETCFAVCSGYHGKLRRASDDLDMVDRAAVLSILRGES